MFLCPTRHSNWKGFNDNLKPFYDVSIHPNLSYQFGNGEVAQFGKINEVPPVMRDYSKG
jgi:hypothetical protein